MKHPLRQWWPLLCAALLQPLSSQAQTATSLDARVQAPELSAPQRGSLAGQLASTAFGPADVSRGGFQLPIPFQLPTERGPLLAQVFPTYAPDSGLSEWGVGWNVELAFTRWRASGTLDYATDELSGPWGRFVQGTDGSWYPVGLSSMVRLQVGTDTLVAYAADGTRFTFGGTARVVTAKGTYSWYLTEVQSVLGRKTRLEYEANTSGRLFLKTVRYGGQGEDFQYRVDFSHEPTPYAFRDMRSGQELVLDRRVKEVVLTARHTQTGLFEERWRYTLGFQEEGLGPAFYLSQVQQTFRSGEQPPPTRYTYHLASEHLATTSLQPLPKVDPLIATYLADVIQPHRSSPLDSDLDGRLDLERHYDNTLLRQVEDGFIAEPLPPAGTDVSTFCRRAPSSLNEPRTLAQLRASEDTHQVVSLRPNSYRTATALTVCDRPGRALATQSLSGDWGLSSNVRLVDLDRDRQPDLVRISSGRYAVLPNTSTASTFSFGPQRQGTLKPAFTPDTSWVHDFNGDGLPDLISRTSTSLVVWWGLGDFTFTETGQSLQLRSASGTLVTTLSDYQLNFLDANKDGLTDLLLTRTSGSTASLFINHGTSFKGVNVPGLTGVNSYSSRPVVGDLAGSGDTELVYTRSGKTEHLTLDTPGTALMRSADDGKGTVLRFEYARGPTLPGTRQRPSVLAALEVRSSGYDTVRYTYDYDQPTLHSVGKFLVGYGSVKRDGPGVVHAVNFLNADSYSGLLSSSTQHDTLSPGLHTYEYRQYEDALYQGVPWKRLKEEGSGWAQEDGQALGERVEYLAYEAEVCPSKTVRHTPSGTLTTEKWRAHPVALAGHPHCLESGTRLTGNHPNTSLDFSNEVHLVRNNVGLVERVEDVSAAGDVLLLQEVVYRPDFLIDRVTVPGKGTTRFVWEPGTQQLLQLISPDGVVVEPSARHPLTSAPQALTTWRGSRAFTQSFAFDGQERLQKQWDSLGRTSEATPGLSLAYRYATATQPGSISLTTLVDADAGANSTAVEWQTASGESVAKASRIPEGWKVDGLTTRSRALLETKAHVRSALGTGVDVTALDYASLLSGTDVVGTLTSSGLGFEASSLARLHTDVSRQVLTQLSVEAGLLKQQSIENGTHSTRRFLDAQQRLVAYEDEANTRYTYNYDALGRLREVLLPGGTGHRVHFDGHGRVSHVVRDGIAQVAYTYQSGTGLLSAKTFLSAAELPVRKEDYVYDASGRQVLVRHTDMLSGATQDYRFYYDGATPTSPARAEATGLLSAVDGEGYTKLFEYRADGKPERKTLHLKGWRTVETSLAYREDGSVRQLRMCHSQADGVPLGCTTLANTPDAFGRPSLLRLNSQVLAELQYNAEGQLAAAAMAGGNWVAFAYDALTRAPSGFSQAGPGLWSSIGWRFNARGLTGTENLEVGGLSLSRAHSYSPQGFLASSTDARAAYAYTYGASGLPARIEENGISRTLVQNGNVLTAGGTTYTFDALGRTATRGDLVFTYGPNGHLAHAARGTQAWDFLYDEAGERLLKRKDGAPLAAYLESGGYLDETGLTLPFKIGTRLVGVIQHGAFRPLAADRQGTILSDYDGTPRLASPYGTRTVPPESSAVLDYVEKGYDADLGLTRMGVRDYDAFLGRFSTPDPLFLEAPDKCLQSPTECNLYAYARSNPLGYVDPDGRKAKQEADTSASTSTPHVPIASAGSPDAGVGASPAGGMAPTGYTFGIGIEPPKPEAITPRNQLNVLKDTGHTFAYWRGPDGKIAEILSFGPGERIDPYSPVSVGAFLNDKLKGTATWPLDKHAQMYEWNITQAQFDAGRAFSAMIKANIGNYTIDRNCTSIAIEAASKSGVTLPKGMGEVVIELGMPLTRVAPNPHALNEQLKASGHPSVTVHTSNLPRP
ncbi:FG-GAP-like repeat-containing protein [Archangium gephyra]|uniref:RHS repeat domain-containing protein n=1 Tax=Archangium gephyra TaxID=48 RepID=UPI0035D4D041